MNTGLDQGLSAMHKVCRFGCFTKCSSTDIQTCMLQKMRQKASKLDGAPGKKGPGVVRRVGGIVPHLHFGAAVKYGKNSEDISTEST